MPFAYFRKLRAPQRRIYEKSDSISGINLPNAHLFHPILSSIKTTLAQGDQANTQQCVQRFLNYFCEMFKVPAVKVQVLERRPSRNWGELHGLYQAYPQGRGYLITVWMRTAKRIQVVAFKTFMRTVLHEFLHHLDYTYFKLGDSFHTQGFYKRESSLVKQLLGSHES